MNNNPCFTLSDNFIHETVYELYCVNEITNFPIDCWKIICNFGLRLYTYAELMAVNERLYRMCRCYSDDAFRYENIIAYNDTKPLGRIRFSLMHELSHCILGHETETSGNEDQANILASNILAPRIMIHKLGCRNADHIHNIFGLSYAASNRALNDYRTWFYQISHTTREPSLPEKQLELIFFPEETKPQEPAWEDNGDEDQEDYDDRYDFFEQLRMLRGDCGLLDSQQWYGSRL